MSWWEGAYRSGHVNWDPGEYGGYSPWVIDRFHVEPCRALDPGCGDGKSAFWLATKGFEVVGIDLVAELVRSANRYSGCSLIRFSLPGEYLAFAITLRHES